MNRVGGEGRLLNIEDDKMPLANLHQLSVFRQILSCLRIVHIT